MNEIDSRSEQDNTGVTIAVSDHTKDHLSSFCGYSGAPFSEMIDAFRFAVSIGLAQKGGDVPDISATSGTTMYNMGSFDRDGVFRSVIQAVAPEACKTHTITRLIRAYGEYGVAVMVEQCENDPSSLDIHDSLESIQSDIDQVNEEVDV